MSLADCFSIELPDMSSVHLLVRSVSGEEALCKPFVFRVAGKLLDLDDIDRSTMHEDILTKDVELHFEVRGERVRTIKGILEGVEQTEHEDLWVVASRTSLLADSVDHEVFVGLDALEIVQKIADRHGVVVKKQTQGTPAKRPHCVRFFETALRFVTDILAEEGMLWFCSDGDEMVIVDDPNSYVEHGRALRVVDEIHGSSTIADDECVFQAVLTKQVVTDKVGLRSYDFTNPALDLTVTQGDGLLEHFEYPALLAGVGRDKEILAARMHQHRDEASLIEAKSNCRSLGVGIVLPLDDETGRGFSGSWLLTQVRHQIGAHPDGQIESVASFRAVLSKEGCRPLVEKRRRPLGVQMMTMTGPSGQEIHTEKFGQVKARFRWDRETPLDDTSSAWFRPIQPPTSGGFLLPRVGWEVLAGFWDSADTPLQFGRLYNGSAPPPDGLPGAKTATAFGTATSPGGGGGHNVHLDDTAGSEAMALTSSKDFNERTENDKMRQVTADDTHSIGANHTLTVGNVYGIKISGSKNHSVGSTRTVNVTSNVVVTAGSETVLIGGLRTFDILGDQATSSASLIRVVGAAKVEAPIEHQSMLVKGVSTVLVGGSWAQRAGLSGSWQVGGAHTEEVAGTKHIKCLSYGLTVKGAYRETYASRRVKSGAAMVESMATSASYDISGAAKYKGAMVMIAASSKLTIKASGITITMTSSEITIDGEFESSQSSEDKDDEDYD